jgi:hypothetical protein
MILIESLIVSYITFTFLKYIEAKTKKMDIETVSIGVGILYFLLRFGEKYVIVQNNCLCLK